jgi:hypothetical protein
MTTAAIPSLPCTTLLRMIYYDLVLLISSTFPYGERRKPDAGRVFVYCAIRSSGPTNSPLSGVGHDGCRFPFSISVRSALLISKISHFRTVFTRRINRISFPGNATPFGSFSCGTRNTVHHQDYSRGPVLSSRLQ